MAAPTTAVAPPTSAPSPGAPAWEQVFATAAGESGNTVVWADDPGGLAVGHPGEWMLVNTSTDETVTADIDATVIGVRPAAGDKFAVITATTDGNAEVLAVSADGSVDSLGTIPGNGTSSADGMLLTAATVTPVGTALYVLVGRQSGGAFPPAPTMAKVQDGVTHPLGDPPGFGPITLDDAGHLIITSPADGRFPSQDGNRWTSADGASWTSISVPQQFGILLGFTAQSVLAFDGRNPPDVGVVDTAGTMTEQFTADESKGWLVVADDGDPHATLVGVATGIGVIGRPHHGRRGRCPAHAVRRRPRHDRRCLDRERPRRARLGVRPVVHRDVPAVDGARFGRRPGDVRRRVLVERSLPGQRRRDGSRVHDHLADQRRLGRVPGADGRRRLGERRRRHHGDSHGR